MNETEIAAYQKGLATGVMRGYIEASVVFLGAAIGSMLGLYFALRDYLP